MTYNQKFASLLTTYINLFYDVDTAKNKEREIRRLLQFMVGKQDVTFNHIFNIECQKKEYKIPRNSILCIVFFSLPDTYFNHEYEKIDRNFFEDTLYPKLEKLEDIDIVKSIYFFNKIMADCQYSLKNYSSNDIIKDEEKEFFIKQCQELLTPSIIKENELTLKKFLSSYKTQYLEFLSTEFMLELYVEEKSAKYIFLEEISLPILLEIYKNEHILDTPLSKGAKYDKSNHKKKKILSNIHKKDSLPMSYDESFITINKLFSIYSHLITQILLLFKMDENSTISEQLRTIEKIYVFSMYVIECQALPFNYEIKEKYYKDINTPNYNSLFIELNNASYDAIKLYNGTHFNLFRKHSKNIVLAKFKIQTFKNFLIDFNKFNIHFKYDLKKITQYLNL